jgi:hypothetical protein
LQASRISIDISNSSTSRRDRAELFRAAPDTGPATGGPAQHSLCAHPSLKHSRLNNILLDGATMGRVSGTATQSVLVAPPFTPISSVVCALSSESVPVQLEGEYLGARGRVRYTVARCQHISSGACGQRCRAGTAAAAAAGLAKMKRRSLNDYLDSLGALDLVRMAVSARTLTNVFYSCYMWHTVHVA